MSELKPIDTKITAQLLSKDTQRVMHFVEWYKDVLKKDVECLEAEISSLTKDHTIDDIHNTQQSLDYIIFHKGEINAIKRMINALDKDITAYCLQYTEKFDDESKEIPVYKCK